MRLRVSAVLNMIELELDRLLFFFFFFERCLDLESKKQEIPFTPHSWRLQVP